MDDDYPSEDQLVDTDLHDAVRKNEFDSVIALIANGADPNEEHFDGACPLESVLKFTN